jgi:hypothetical protein
MKWNFTLKYAGYFNVDICNYVASNLPSLLVIVFLECALFEVLMFRVSEREREGGVLAPLSFQHSL